MTNKINRFRIGYVFTPSDFYDIVDNSSVVSRILSQLVREGTIRRLSKGKYDRPKQSVFGLMPASSDWLVREFLFDGKKIIGYISGTRAFAQMGLTTQISAEFQIGTNTYRRAVTRGDHKISFILQPNVITRSNIYILQLLDALRFIQKIPATTPDSVIIAIRSRIRELSVDERNMLSRLSMAYTSYVRAMVGALLDEMNDDTSMLFKSLNLASVYKPGISKGTLPNAKKWRIA